MTESEATATESEATEIRNTAGGGWQGGKNAFGDFAPGLVHYTDRVLFDEVWERVGLSKRDRSLVTVAALAALGKTEQLEFHLAYARRNGVTDPELQEAMLQLAFYAGWPNGMGAAAVLKRVVEGEDREDDTGSDEDAVAPTAGDPFAQMFPLGEPNAAYAVYFTGQSYLAPLTDGSVPVSNVTFEPGCRNHWRIHHGEQGGGDQILLCTAGAGWYQAEGEDAVSLVPGTAIRVPAGVKHWHGAKADTWFSHVAFIAPGENVTTEWLDPVTDEAYGQLPRNGDRA
jgi:4-carboxymuconolactone decarboxylase